MTVPMKRYPIYIDAFQAFVAKKQEEINLASAYEQLYIVVRDVLLDREIKNEHELKLSSDGVFLSIKLFFDNQLSDFADIIQKIGTRLVNLKLRNDAEPAVCKPESYGTEYANYTFRINNRREKRPLSILITLNIPEQGTVEYTHEAYNVSYTSRRVVLRDKTKIHSDVVDIPL